MRVSISTKTLNWLVLGLVFVLSAWLVLKVAPTAVVFARNADSSHQLAGANEILRGYQPVIDFSGFYGPLTFYASALAQWVVGVRPIGEIGLVTAGFALGYTLYFAMMHMATRRYWLAALGLAVMLITIPKLYKYYIVLGPALVLAATWFYCVKRSRLRLWLVGLSIAFVGLYRPDYGVYGMLAATTALMLEPESSLRQRLKTVLYLVMTVIVAASPWLIVVTVRGELGRYLFESSIGSLDQAVGQAGGLPVFNVRNPLSGNSQRAVLSMLLFLAPAVAATLLVVSWRRTDPGLRPRLAAMIVLGATTLLQSIHRADYSHLLQAIPTDLLILTWLAGQGIQALRLGTRIWLRIAAGAGLAAIGLVAALLLHLSAGQLDLAIHSRPLANLEPFTLPRDAFLDRVVQITRGKDTRLSALKYLRDCSQPGDTVIGWPYGMNVYYFADRLAGNRILGFSPGFYSSPEQQQVTIAELKTSKPKFWIYKPFLYSKGLQFVEDYEPQVAAYLKEAYVPVKAFGDTTILIDAGDKDQFHCAATP